LAEYAIDEINLDGIGTLLAMTGNDEVNSLAVIRYAEIFDSSQVYQLAPISKHKRAEQEVPQHLSGRILFDKDLNFTEIEHLISEGASFECVELAENETYQDFYNEHDHNSIALFSITSTNDIIVSSEDNKQVPTDAQKVI